MGAKHIHGMGQGSGHYTPCWERHFWVERRMRKAAVHGCRQQSKINPGHSYCTSPSVVLGAGVGNYAQAFRMVVLFVSSALCSDVGISVSDALRMLYFLNPCLLVSELRIITYGTFSSQHSAQHNVGSQSELPGLICLI